MNIPQFKCNSDNLHRSQAEATSCLGCLAPIQINLRATGTSNLVAEEASDTSDSPQSTPNTDSSRHNKHSNAAAATAPTPSSVLSVPVRATQSNIVAATSQQMTSLRASHHDLVDRLRDSTFLVERLQTREIIAIAERDRARADAQRIQEELNAAVTSATKAKSTSLKFRALVLLLGIIGVLIALQWANRKLYQPEFEWMARMTRDALGLD